MFTRYRAREKYKPALLRIQTVASCSRSDNERIIDNRHHGQQQLFESWRWQGRRVEGSVQRPGTLPRSASCMYPLFQALTLCYVGVRLPRRQVPQHRELQLCHGRTSQTAGATLFLFASVQDTHLRLFDCRALAYSLADVASRLNEPVDAAREHRAHPAVGHSVLRLVSRDASGRGTRCIQAKHTAAH